eukprot:Lithocolla_globosa_v1_NODE_1654_length_2416_cov_88.241847.p2 type:complete len:441 gc:universal NODE_1654_length_2416_cov_88.241847:564-1886(+)
MVGQEVCYIQDFTAYNDPSICVGCVFLDFVPTVCLLVLDWASLSARVSASRQILSWSGGGGGSSSRSSSGNSTGDGGRGSVPRDIEADLLGRGVNSQGQTRVTTGNTTGLHGLGHIANQETGSSSSRDTTENNTVQQRRTTETVLAVNSTSNFTTSEKTRNGGILFVDDGAFFVNGETTHAVVDNGGNNGNVVRVIEVNRQVVEEFLAEDIGRGSTDTGVFSHGVSQNLGRATNLLGNLSTGLELFHHTTTAVVLAVPFNFLGGLAVQQQTERTIMLPHFSRNVVTASELVTESLSVTINQNTTAASESFSSQKLHLGFGFVRVNKASGVNLDEVHVDGTSSETKGHFDAITGTVVTVGGGQFHQLRSVTLQQRIILVVSSVTTGGENNGSHFCESLTVLNVFTTDNSTILLDQFGDGSFNNNSSFFAVGFLLDVFKFLH